VRYTSPVFVVSQYKLVSGGGLRKQRISAIVWALWLGKDFTFLCVIRITEKLQVNLCEIFGTEI